MKKINERLKRRVILGAVVALNVGMGCWAYEQVVSRQIVAYRQVRAEAELAKNRYEEALQSEREYAQNQVLLETILAEPKVLGAEELASVLLEMSDMMGVYGVEQTAFDVGQRQSADEEMVTWPVVVKGIGTYEAVVAYIAAVTELGFVVWIEDVEMRKESAADTYRFEVRFGLMSEM